MVARSTAEDDAAVARVLALSVVHKEMEGSITTKGDDGWVMAPALAQGTGSVT